MQVPAKFKIWCKRSFGNSSKIIKWIAEDGSRHRDAFIYLLFTAVFSILPTISGFLLLLAFGQWAGDWAKLLGSGDLLVATTSLMATSVYVFRKPDARLSVLKTISFSMALVVMVLATLFYAALALIAHGIIPPDTKMLPRAIIISSLGLYGLALMIGFHAFYLEQPLPSNTDIRNEQVTDLESQLDEMEASND